MRRPGAIVVLGVVLTACSFPSGGPTTTVVPPTTTTSTTLPPTLPAADQAAVVDTVQALLDAWAAGDFPAVREISPDADHDLLGLHVAWTEGISLQAAAYEVTGGTLTADGVVAEYRADLDLGAAGIWSYTGSLAVEETGEGWRVPWSPAIIHPALEEGDRLFLERRWPERAAVLGTGGVLLVTERAVKTIGVVPERIDDQEALLAALEEHADIPRSTVLRELGRPGVQPDWYLPVGWLPLVDYLPVQSQLEAVPGLEMRDDTARLAPAGPFADQLLGTTGPITAEMLADLGDPYREGDVVGLSGLERRMERSLAGHPNFEVQRINQFGRVVEVLHTVDGVTPAPVRTTLSVEVQLAAEAAMADVESPAALVAVDAATGEIRAVVSRPLEGFDRALLGLYPPGSTSKVVTAYGLLTAGFGPASPVECPGTVTVGGREFRNAGEFDLGTVELQRAFARSCNTTFGALAAGDLGADGLMTAAAVFGYGSGYVLPVDFAMPRFPQPAEAADVAAAAIGQGAVLTTPLHQASVAGAVAAGTWHAPTLLERAETVDPVALDPGAAADLATMMRLVVTDGTGESAGVPGEEVFGKTGSAEWSETEPTHAWFIGYWDGLAFAVVVESGGAGGSVAGPIAAAFVEALAG